MSTPVSEDLVPDEVIPHHNLPPLRYRDLPEAPPWTRLVGPSVILAGLALGSGEFIFWPYITYRSGFVFFWVEEAMKVVKMGLFSGSGAALGYSVELF